MECHKVLNLAKVSLNIGVDVFLFVCGGVEDVHLGFWLRNESLNSGL